VVEVTFEDILILPDKDFNPDMTCIVAGCGGEIGRAIAIAASANNLMTIGLDSDGEEGKKTQKLARDIGGQMIFLETDLESDKGLECSIYEASKLGTIKYLANVAKIEGTAFPEVFTDETYDFIRHAMLRVPLYLSKLTIPRMKKSSNGTGVIGNLLTINSTLCGKDKTFDSVNGYVLEALRKSTSVGEGNIRFFTIYSGSGTSLHKLNRFAENNKYTVISGEKSDRNVITEKQYHYDLMTPIEIANMFIFGFSRYSRRLIEGSLLFDGKLL